MAVSIRLKYGNFERVFDEYIGEIEYIIFPIKSKKASILLAFFVSYTLKTAVTCYLYYF